MPPTIADLEAEQTRLHGEAKALGAHRKAIAAQLDALRAAEAARAKVAAMSPAERTAVAQVLVAAAIASGEAVGTPGR